MSFTVYKLAKLHINNNNNNSNNRLSLIYIAPDHSYRLNGSLGYMSFESETKQYYLKKARVAKM